MKPPPRTSRLVAGAAPLQKYRFDSRCNFIPIKNLALDDMYFKFFEMKLNYPANTLKIVKESLLIVGYGNVVVFCIHRIPQLAIYVKDATIVILEILPLHFAGLRGHGHFSQPDSLLIETEMSISPRGLTRNFLLVHSVPESPPNCGQSLGPIRSGIAP
jgi:hypothetical protein